MSLPATAGTIGDGLANLPMLLLPRMDKTNSQLVTFDATPRSGSETVRDGDWWTTATGGLPGGDHKFTAADATSGGTSHAPPPTWVVVVPNITTFSSASGSRITVDGHMASVQNANQPWSLTQSDANTLQFTVKSGDHWSTAGWSDLTNDAGAERSEIAFSPNYAAGTQI